MDGAMDGFLDALASEAPAPGAGAAVAVTVAMAAGLLAMFARSSVDLPDRDALAARADDLRAAAFDLIEADRVAYTRVLEHRPRRQSDPDGFREVVAAANQPLLAACQIADRTVDAGLGALPAGNPAVRPDLTAGLFLARSAVTVATGLIEANTRVGRLSGDDLDRARRHDASLQQRLDGVVGVG